jgi:hypothetical protein
MQYRLVYDVLNDGFPWFGVAFTVVPLLLAIACGLEMLERIRGKARVPMPRVPGRINLKATPFSLVVVSFLVLASAVVFLASRTYEGYMQRQRCREWTRTGQYQVAEGTITDYQFRKAGARFSVAGLSFELLERSAGFTGRFNVPTRAEGSLRDGSRVRLAHREGFILRLEIASELPL